MTIPNSTVPAVKIYLLNLLGSTLTQEPGYQLVVCLDDPGPEQPDDIVSIGAVQRKAELYQMIGSMNAGSFLETYDMHIVISTFRGGPDQGWPFQRAWALASAVEAAVRADPTCAGNVIKADPKESRDTSSWEPEHKGRLVEVEIILSVMAQI